MSNKLDNLKKGNGFDKNSQNINFNGRPKGKSKRTYLKELVKDIVHLYKGEINPYTKKIIYDIYSIALSDYSNNVVSDTISHLYFMESDFGIKIGISKDVKNRLRQIKNYAPSTIIIKTIPFAGNFEKLLHKKFKKQNIKNNPLFGVEWFYKNDDLYSFIAETNTILDLANEFNHVIPKQLQLF
jgi:hypothetical protein